MEDFISGIDHPVIAVREMDAARSAFERLGFTIAPRGRHLPWGTGNWCIMFPDDYLELRGIIDPHKFTHDLESVLEKGEGFMGVAIGTADASAIHAELVQRGLHPQPVRELTRSVELPDGRIQLSFSLCFLDQSETGGLMSVVFCQHRTPELLRQPAWLAHANGARGLRALTCVVPDLDEAAAAHQQIFGADAVRRNADRLEVQVGQRGQILVTSATSAANANPLLDLGQTAGDSFLAVATIEVDDLSRCARLLESRHVEHAHTSAGGICVAASEACGAIMEFVSTQT